MEVLDFELEVRADGSDFVVVVDDSPDGQARAPFVLPFDEPALRAQLGSLESVVSRPRQRRIASPVEQTVTDFGRVLFETLFTGDVRTAFEASRLEARRRECRLRISLRIEVPSLAALPWEFMFDPHDGDFVCLSIDTPIVRYLDVQRPAVPLKVSAPLRILVAIASPSNLVKLNVAGERERLELALASLVANRTIEIVVHEAPTWHDLQQALWAGPWHVFHFIGHGDFDPHLDEGVIALVDEHGRSDAVSATNLGRLLGGHAPMRLAVLNACDAGKSSETDVFSSTAASLVRRGTPAVLAMQYPINDDAALELSRSFYDAIAGGQPVEDAVTSARQALCHALHGSFEWGIPVLYTHAPGGVLFDFDNAVPRAAPEPVERGVRPPPEAPPARRARRPRRALALVGAAVAGLAALVAAILGLGHHSSRPNPARAPRAATHESHTTTSVGAIAWDDRSQGGTTRSAPGTLSLALGPVQPGGADDLAKASTRCGVPSSTYDVTTTFRIDDSLLDRDHVGILADNAGIQRAKTKDGVDEYVFQDATGKAPFVVTTDDIGQLRLRRDGPTSYGYVRDDSKSQWILVGKGPNGATAVSKSPAIISLQMWGAAANTARVVDLLDTAITPAPTACTQALAANGSP